MHDKILQCTLEFGIIPFCKQMHAYLAVGPLQTQIFIILKLLMHIVDNVKYRRDVYVHTIILIA